MTPAWRMRVWSRVEITDTCWLWTGHTERNGYPVAWVDKINVLAHRLVYEILVGTIPDGLEIDHLCRVRRCVRPDHLEPVTHAENMRRARWIVCKQGHPLTADNVYYHRRGGRTCRTCALARAAAHRMRAA